MITISRERVALACAGELAWATRLPSSAVARTALASDAHHRRLASAAVAADLAASTPGVD